MSDVGFDRVNFCLLTDHTQIKESARHGVALNYPDDWVKNYTENQYFGSDPVIQRAYRAHQAFGWDYLRPYN